MAKWRVRVRKSVEMVVEVEADTEYQARDLAEERARTIPQEREPDVEILHIERLRHEAERPPEDMDQLYSDLK